MSKSTLLNVKKRERAGKGAARAERRAGLIPGVIYGDKKPPVLISIDPKLLNKEMNIHGFWTRQFEIDVEGNTYRTMCQDVQMHPVTDRPEHVDFLRISKEAMLTVEVPVHFINETSCPGIKLGGVLNVVRRFVEVHCKADDIPEGFTFDLAGRAIGEAVKISAIKLPKGVTPTITDRDFTIATIAAPSSVKDDAVGATEGEAAEAAPAEAEKKAKE